MADSLGISRRPSRFRLDATSGAVEDDPFAWSSEAVVHNSRSLRNGPERSSRVEVYDGNHVSLVVNSVEIGSFRYGSGAVIPRTHGGTCFPGLSQVGSSFRLGPMADSC